MEMISQHKMRDVKTRKTLCVKMTVGPNTVTMTNVVQIYESQNSVP